MDERVTPRSPRIYLGADVARCEPGRHCPMRGHCARYMAELPPAGAILMDGTMDPRWSPAFCPAYLSAAAAVRSASPAPRPARRHWDDEGS